MPPLPNQPGVLRVDYGFDIGSDIAALDRIYLQYTGTPPTDPSCVTIAGLIYASFVTRMQGFFTPSRVFRSLEVTDLTTPTSGQGSHLTNTAGTRGGDELPAEVCTLFNYSIGRRYRGGKPRTYWPFGAGGDVATPQTWGSGYTAAVQTDFQLHVDDILAITTGGIVIVGLCNISYYSGFTAVTNPITGRTRDVPKVRAVAIPPDAITGFLVNPVIASQRRRELHSR